VRGLTGTQDVIIPAGLIPWGDTFTVIVWPSWDVDKAGYACGVGGGTRPEASGQLGGGEYSGFPSTITLEYVELCDDALGIVEASPLEAPDGSLSEFTLIAWDGTGKPQMHRNGVLMPLVSSDPAGATVTVQEAPRAGDVVTARYHVGAV
jgi:hypothetical protein